VPPSGDNGERTSDRFCARVAICLASQCQDRVSPTLTWAPWITQAWLGLPASHFHRVTTPLSQALFAVEPHVVHFAGHGDAREESIVVADEYGYIHTIPVDGLVQAFRAAGQGVRCVVVNACSTERLAQALAATGLCVIGMRQPVGDQSAVRFSIGFYQALADGRSVETAFGSGVAQLMMTPLGDDARAPFLLSGG
jgi:CHAT domain